MVATVRAAPRPATAAARGRRAFGGAAPSGRALVRVRRLRIDLSRREPSREALPSRRLTRGRIRPPPDEPLPQQIRRGKRIGSTSILASPLFARIVQQGTTRGAQGVEAR